MKNVSTRILILVLLVIAAGLLPLVLPYGMLKPKLESHLSQALRGKVEIGRIHFSYLPKPALLLEELTLDSADAAQIKQVVIPASLRNLLGFGKSLHEVKLSGPVFSRAFALGLPERLSSESPLRLGEIALDDVVLNTEQGALGPFKAKIALTSDHRFETLTAQLADGKANLQIQPAGSGNFSMIFSAKNWQLPISHPLNVEYLNLTGQTNGDALQITDLRAGLYHGLVTGSGQLRWNGRWQLSGQIQAKNIQAEPLIAAFSPVTRATGLLQGEGAFRFNADHYTRLFDTPQLQGRFTLVDGLLHNIDLITPLKSSSTEIVRHGGQTSFNQLRGTLGVQGKTVSLRAVQLDAGKFRASGDVSVREGKLAGGAASTLSTGSMTATNQVTLSGTLDSPELRSGGTWRPATASDAEFDAQ